MKTSGKHPLCIEAGGIRVGMRLGGSSARALARRRYRGFLSRRKPHVMLELSRQQAELGIQSPAVTNGASVRCRSARFGWRLDPAERATDSRRCQARSCGNPEDLDSLLRTLYMHLISERGGIMLHAAAFAADGTAHLFVGPSGAGKTTLRDRLNPLHDIACLSDELVLARRTPSGYRLYSTPFWGEFGMPENNGSAPLGKILFLGKGPLRVSPLGPAEAQRRLLRCLVSFETSGEALRDSWDLALDMVRLNPTAELSWDGHETRGLTKMLWNRSNKKGTPDFLSANAKRSLANR